ncbi:type II and III secretion system protein [Deinococcus hopiensis]|uniref:type II and III secretion system protein n=1 Tax=Deinococcus hopiensis TaxID=309885 RepID=UPI002481DB80|nr:type II and III secretion system protein [Deinococcus hopiensis]
MGGTPTSGAAHVLAQPRVTTIDGLEARINSTQTTPVITGQTGGGTSVQTITTGITLRLTLTKVAPDGTVETSPTISVSVPTGTTSQGVPNFSTREAITTVRVGNGEPIAIDELLETRKVEGSQKVLFLGDILILGKLFTTTRSDIHNTDLVIVVTPRLVITPNQH